MDPRVNKLADVLVNYSVAVKPGDKVLIEGNTVTEPLIKAVYKKVLQVGAHPLVWVRLPGMNELRFRYASDEELESIPEPIKMIFETFEVGVTIWGSENTKALSNVTSDKMVLSKRAETEIMKTSLHRMATGEFRWVGTQFPIHAEAQSAEMGLLEYEDFVYGACLPDIEDPVDYWQRFSARQQKIVDWFMGKEWVRVLGPGTDLQFSILDRVFINCDGHENMPDGEIYTEPVKESVEGQVRFSYPTYYRYREVAGVCLWFKNGKVVKATADKGEDYLLKMLDTDEGSRYVGEFAVGTNQGITQFTKNTLFDEKIFGTFHLALGAGFPETGGGNESAIHWDMVSDLRAGGEIWVDDELVYKDGKFVIEF